MERLYVDFHVIQTVPPSCVNRDDVGSPKTSVYGGVTRARVSSQSWKHSMRIMFNDIFPVETVGKRTKELVKLVADAIMAEEDMEREDAEKKAAEALNLAAGIKVKDNKNEALFFISEAQVKALAHAELNQLDDKKENKKAMKKAIEDAPSYDMALFGRMVAADPSLNYDACSQVAHAISTHEVHTEYDYFTAVDDCSTEDNAGAGHLGTMEFNSETLYRYANVNVAELFKLLGSDTSKVVRGFAEAFVKSMPDGKQNSYANRTLPDMVYVIIRNDQPINLSGAFEKPVRAGKDGYVSGSEDALISYEKSVTDMYGDKPLKAFVAGYKGSLETEAEAMSFPAILDSIEKFIKDNISE